MRIALGVEYHGAGFVGFQSQREGTSIQGCLEAALSRVADHPLRIVCAGRTDAGVHALAQVVHFDTTAERRPRGWVLGANVHLPRAIAARWAQVVPDSFHARYSALARHYRYLILNRWVRPALDDGRVCWEHRPLDAARMHRAAQHLVGEHDFTSFRAQACQAKHPLREIRYIRVTRHDDRVVLDIAANAFLHHMVRNIAGVLMTIGSGEQAPEWAREVLELRDRTRSGVTAPAAGLYFMGVSYPPEFGLPEGDAGMMASEPPAPD
jgi:tRNA pseudouridine38-40 synthase